MKLFEIFKKKSEFVKSWLCSDTGRDTYISYHHDFPQLPEPKKGETSADYIQRFTTDALETLEKHATLSGALRKQWDEVEIKDFAACVSDKSDQGSLLGRHKKAYKIYTQAMSLQTKFEKSVQYLFPLLEKFSFPLLQSIPTFKDAKVNELRTRIDNGSPQIIKLFDQQDNKIVETLESDIAQSKSYIAKSNEDFILTLAKAIDIAQRGEAAVDRMCDSLESTRKDHSSAEKQEDNKAHKPPPPEC